MTLRILTGIFYLFPRSLRICSLVRPPEAAFALVATGLLGGAAFGFATAFGFGLDTGLVTGLGKGLVLVLSFAYTGFAFAGAAFADTLPPPVTSFVGGLGRVPVVGVGLGRAGLYGPVVWGLGGLVAVLGLGLVAGPPPRG